MSPLPNSSKRKQELSHQHYDEYVEKCKLNNEEYLAYSHWVKSENEKFHKEMEAQPITSEEVLKFCLPKSKGTKRTQTEKSLKHLHSEENKNQLRKTTERANQISRRGKYVRKTMKETLLSFLEANYEDFVDFLEWDYGVELDENKNHIKKNMEVTTKLTFKFFEDRNIPVTMMDCVCLAAIKNGVYRGDKGILEFIRDTIGEKPRDKVDIDANVQAETGYSDLARRLFGSDEEDNGGATNDSLSDDLK